MDGCGNQGRGAAEACELHPKIGYPSQWRDNERLEIAAQRPDRQGMRHPAFEHEYQVGKLGGPIRKLGVGA